jgi:hypothetical protein
MTEMIDKLVVGVLVILSFAIAIWLERFHKRWKDARSRKEDLHD